MARPKKNFGPKDPYEDLPQDFRDAAVMLSEEDVKKRIADIAMTQVELTKAKKEDQDLKEKQEQVKMALEPYREGRKINQLKIDYLRKVLEDRGLR